MELKEFIKETLVQIAEGVKEASDQLDGMDFIINPSTDMQGKKVGDKQESYRAIQSIEFTVAVTVESSKGSKQGIGVFMAAMSLGAAERQDYINKGISEIKFTLPVSFPFKGKPAWTHTALR